MKNKIKRNLITVFQNGSQQILEKNNRKFQTPAIPISINFRNLSKQNFAKSVSPFATINDYLSESRFSKKFQIDGLFSPSFAGHAKGFDSTC